MAPTLGEIADRLSARLTGGDPGTPVSGVAPFDRAGPGEITCAASAKLLARVSGSRAEAVIVGPGAGPSAVPLLVVGNPLLTFARAIALFHRPPAPEPGISPHAVVGQGFVHGEDLFVAPGVVIGKGVRVGDRVTLLPNVVLGDGVVLGDDVTIHPQACVLWGCTLGSRVVIHAGAVIGADGFGFAGEAGKLHKIPQTGVVTLGDDVEIGANNTIDRATFGATAIGNGVKTDNLVHVAHNVTVGDDTVLIAQCGISGGTVIGKNCVLAGQAGVAGHLTIGDFVMVGPQ
ncbi:MAG: UDP-3-O-(3-hydroxymyristoyl)glucosamine N-acyltransferase, partial [Pseudomonadota bacterium]